MVRGKDIETKISRHTGGTVAVDTGAEAFVELLNANNVDYIFLNPGTDTTPVQEAIAKLHARGRRTPQIILCLDESVAMAAAHGYFMVTGRPQVVLVHVDVGTQQVGGALHNAQRSRIGVVLCAGRAPSTITGSEKQPGRSSGVMWWQEQYDQAGIVRNFVKWDYELRSTEDAGDVVQRAFQVASTQPAGPVYLVLPRGVLTEKVTKVQIPDTARFGAASSPQADTELLAKSAEILLQAENPLIVTGHSGRNPNAVAALVELAETLSVRVINSDVRMNFPNRHPLSSETDILQNLPLTDALLIIDNDIPYTPSVVRPRADCKIIQIDIDPIKEKLPLWGFPTDILLHGDSCKTMPVLTGLIRHKMTAEQKARIQARFRKIADEKKQAEAKLKDLIMEKSKQTPIAPEWLCYCLNELVDEDTIITNEFSPAPRLVKRSKPGTLFGSGGSSLGFAIGSGLGAKLAAPDKTVVSLMGDGCFVFGCPTASLWAANVYHIPYLNIILNNSGYNAVRTNLRSTFGKDNYAEKDSFFAGLDISPSPNYALIAQACNAYGETVTDPADVKNALRRGLEQVKNGKAAVLDVRTARPVARGP